MRFILAALVALSLTPAMAAHRVRHHVLRHRHAVTVSAPVESLSPALTGGGSLGYNIGVLRDTD